MAPSIANISSLVYALSQTYTKSFIFGGQISSNLEEMKSEATPTS